jgi:hypothetical protein
MTVGSDTSAALWCTRAPAVSIEKIQGCVKMTSPPGATCQARGADAVALNDELAAVARAGRGWCGHSPRPSAARPVTYKVLHTS